MGPRSTWPLTSTRVEFFGYRDSDDGLARERRPGSFWDADLDEAAGRLADILRDENVDVVTAYDQNSTYRHPDHVQVRRVGTLATQLAETPKLYWSTVNRDRILGLDEKDVSERAHLELGVRADQLTTSVDVISVLLAKRNAIGSHGSQFDQGTFFPAMDPELFRHAFGQEWFILAGPLRAPKRTTSSTVSTDRARSARTAVCHAVGRGIEAAVEQSTNRFTGCTDAQPRTAEGLRVSTLSASSTPPIALRRPRHC